MASQQPVKQSAIEPESPAVERAESSESSEITAQKSRRDANIAAELAKHRTAASSKFGSQSRQAGSNIEHEPPPPKPSWIKRIWTKTGLDVPTLILMFKNGLPPIISLAIFQAHDVADVFTTLGYLVAIASALSVCIMPRAKFLQTMLINILTISLAAAVNLFALWTSVKAREHTTPPGQPLAGYNSSQSAVCAIWFIVQIYVVNSIKAYNIQFQFPSILFSIFVSVSMTIGPNFPTTPVIESFVRRLLIAFLTGFAIATGVSLFIFPLSSRKIVLKEMTGYVRSLQSVIKAEMRYIGSLRAQNLFRSETAKSHVEAVEHHAAGQRSMMTPEAAALKGAVGGLRALHGKLAADLTFGKREIAYGLLSPEDLSEFFKLLRESFLPIAGAASLIDIFQRVAEIYGWDRPKATDEERVMDAEQKRLVSADWASAMDALHVPFDQISTDMVEGLDHVLICLKFIERPSRKGNLKTRSKGKGATDEEDVEAKGDTVLPGDPGFAEYYEKRIQLFYDSRVGTLKKWALERGIALPEVILHTQLDGVESPLFYDSEAHSFERRDQRQLFVLLYMEYMLWSAAKSVLKMVRFADAKVEDGTVRKKRLIFPGVSRLKKWARSLLSPEDESAQEDPEMINDRMDNEPYLIMGEGYRGNKDPEHLPAETWFEKVGEVLRRIPRALRSKYSAFGFRVAVASMCIAIVAFLKDTHTFFSNQRLFWAVLMVILSMTRTSGQAIFQFFSRFLGTLMAMVASYIVWYIVDGKIPGVLVFLYIYVSCASYILIKMPKYLVAGLISVITSILVVGYELQIPVLGVKLATSNGQLYYPIYELAPYRLACVAAGLFVAFVWTIFPYPIAEHSELRRDTAASLYLLANQYALAHETVASRIRNDEGDIGNKSSPGRQMEKHRQRIYAKQTNLIQKLKTSSNFFRWEIPMGGRFPKQRYDKIIELIESLTSFTVLMSYTSRSFQEQGDNESAWQRDFRELLSSFSITSQEITSLLGLLSSSVSSGHPLPPYLALPQPFRLLTKLVAHDKDILSVSHIAEPGYAAFAVLQIASRCIIGDLHKLAAEVKELVGELDFSFTIHNTKTASEKVD